MTRDRAAKEPRGIQSIEVGAKLLAALTEQGQPVMLKDLARQAGIAAAQAHAYLTSYRKLGLVEQDSQAGRYRLGSFALDLGITRIVSSDPLEMARDTVVSLAESTGLAAVLVVWGSYGPTVVQVHEGGNQIHMETRVGTVYSITGTASGRVFAAFMPEILVRQMMKAEKKGDATGVRVGRPAIVSPGELQQIRDRGHVVLDGVPLPGISALSAPAFDHAGQILCVVTLIEPTATRGGATRAELAEELMAATEALSRQLGYPGGRSPPG